MRAPLSSTQPATTLCTKYRRFVQQNKSKKNGLFRRHLLVARRPYPTIKHRRVSSTH
jgi:hypothetical protein